MSEMEWQPARIAGPKHVLQFHLIDPGAVSRYAGEIVLVRKSDEVFKQLMQGHRTVLGCHAEYMLEVHPDDCRRLWPDIDNVGICEHYVLTD